MLENILPFLAQFLSSQYSPPQQQVRADPWGGQPMSWLPAEMGGQLPQFPQGNAGATPVGNPAGSNQGLEQLLGMMGQGQGGIPKPLGSPDWPRGVAGYGHGDMRKVEGIQMPEVKHPALPSLIAMLSRMQ